MTKVHPCCSSNNFSTQNVCPQRVRSIIAHARERVNCERSEPVTQVGWRISLVYNTTYLVPRGPPVTRNARKRRTGRLRFNGQYNRLENGYFSSKPWLEIGSSYEAADLPTYL